MSHEARTVTHGNASEIAEWCGGYLVEEKDALDPSVTQPGINVPCFQHGDEAEIRRASVGSTVVKVHDGTFRVVK